MRTKEFQSILDKPDWNWTSRDTITVIRDLVERVNALEGGVNMGDEQPKPAQAPGNPEQEQAPENPQPDEQEEGQPEEGQPDQEEENA